MERRKEEVENLHALLIDRLEEVEKIEREFNRERLFHKVYNNKETKFAGSKLGRVSSNYLPIHKHFQNNDSPEGSPPHYKNIEEIPHYDRPKSKRINTLAVYDG